MSRDRANRAKFPATAVPLLIDEMGKLGATGPFTAKMVGGASMFAALLPTAGVNMGERNVEAVRRALGAAGIGILHVRDGRLVVRSLNRGEHVL